MGPRRSRISDDDVAESILRDQHDQCGGYADQRMGTQAGALRPELPFQPNERGQDQGERKLLELNPGLSLRLDVEE